MFRCRNLILALLIQLLFVVGHTSAQKKTYRGEVGGQHIQMELSREGDVMVGRYSYDQFQRDLRLEGRLNKDGRLELKETDNKRHTGTFVCKRDEERNPPLFDLECDWTKPNGSGQVLALLMEQAIDLPKGLSIKPKVINQRARSVYVSYPELISDGTYRVEKFNTRLPTLIRQAMGDIADAAEKNASFDTNYYVLSANDEVVSIEMTEYSYLGGAHPNDRWWTFNYDVKNGREFSFNDVFKSDPAFNDAVKNYAIKEINKLAVQIEEAEARSEKRAPKREEEPFMSADELPEITSWGFTPKGVTVYFDFPHVAAVFSKVFIPYSEIKSFVKPGTPIARFVQ